MGIMNIDYLASLLGYPLAVGLSTQSPAEIHDTQKHVNFYKDKKKPFQNELFVVI